MHPSNITIVLYGNHNIKCKVPCFDRDIVHLHTKISYNTLYYMYNKLRFNKAIVCLYTMISYNIVYYMYDKTRFDRIIARLCTTTSYNILYYMY